MRWLMILLLLCVVGCSSKTDTGAASDSPDASAEGAMPGAETPAARHGDQQAAAMEALQGMLAAARAGDWETYVDDYYGENFKFTDSGDRDALVGRYRDDWGPQVLPVLEAASQVTPVVADGRAVFELESGQALVLYAGEDGAWKFHL